MPDVGRREAARVRPAALADARRIAAIHDRAWRHAYAGLLPDEVVDSRDAREFAEDVMRAMTARDDSRSYLVVEGGRGSVRKLAGFAVLGPAPDASLDGLDSRANPAGELFMIYVDPRWMGRGYGHALHGAVLAEAARAGFASLVLWVLPLNRRARAFYAAHGWTCDEAERIEHVGEFRVPEIRYVRDV